MDNAAAKKLEAIYYDPNHPAAYGGIGKLSKAASLPVKVVTDWLKSQPTYTLHKPARRQGYKTRKYFTSGIDHQWQCDLMDMQAEAKFNDGYKYILTVIDLFSRQAWAQPVMTKSPIHVKPAFEKIFTSTGRKPLKIQSDQGLEFESKTMKDFFQSHKIIQFSVKSQFKAAIVERLNRTLKDRLWRHFTRWNTRKWLEVLPQILVGYNQSFHRGIKTTPNDINKDNEMWLWLQREPMGATRTASKKFKVGDHVRINRQKGQFEQGYLPNWSEEVYTIYKIILGNPTQYKIKDYEDNIVEGSFYIEEIQLVDKPETFRIERIIETRKVRGKNQYLIKWLGYPNQFNQWIDEKQFVKLDQK